MWKWFASSPQRATEADAVRLDLLKSTYRLDPVSQPKLHGLAEDLRQQMGLSCSITLFGYLMNIHADAWLEFCRRENLAPSIGTEGMPGEELLQKALVESRLLGFSENEAKEYARRAGVSIERLKTMTNVADELQGTYRSWVGRWEWRTMPVHPARIPRGE